MPTFSLAYAPPVLSLRLRCIRDAPLPLLTYVRNPELRDTTSAPLHYPRKNTFGQSAVTHCLKDGCLQANLLAVYAFPHRFTLSRGLGPLAADLDCFPFDNGSYHSLSHCHAALTPFGV